MRHSGQTESAANAEAGGSPRGSQDFITVRLRRDWIDDVERAIGEDGSNDEEHDLLYEALDAAFEQNNISPTEPPE